MKEAPAPGRGGGHDAVALLLRDRRGVVMTEYAVLISVVVMVSGVAFVNLGRALVADFNRGRALVIYPVP